jgi:hypothetical protein
MRQIRIPKPKKTTWSTKTADLELDLRTPSGRELPY